MEKRLIELINKANNESLPWIKKARLATMRARWDKIKFAKPLGRCYVCLSKAQCFHHVIPISRKGSYHWRNVVPLCHPCHARIHPWLQNGN